ncbi:outer membrane protein assembly factor BamE [Methylomonas sp. HYX-M1]|uniref:outer membrane protein assembly factor BamE n=1 Tax=Methylomonas sp. HYX-M1 TaxID=3139307 RepID=UPI00345C14D9
MGCQTILSNLPGVYSIDIEQGNIVDQAMVDQLRPNMTKRQVLYIMGSPMLSDTFHEQRWDYLYSDQPGGEARMQKRISLYFSGENLVGVQGDFRPSAMPVVKQSTETTVDVPKRELDSTMGEKITGLFSSDPDTAAVAERSREAVNAAKGGLEDSAETQINEAAKSAGGQDKTLWEKISGIFDSESEADGKAESGSANANSKDAGK